VEGTVKHPPGFAADERSHTVEVLVQEWQWFSCGLQDAAEAEMRATRTCSCITGSNSQ